MLRRRIVPYRNSERAIFSARDQSRIGIYFQPLVAQFMQQLERIKCWLGNAVRCDQPEPTVERRLHHSLLLENIGEGPILHDVDQTIALPYGVGKPWPHVGGICDIVLIHVAGIELAPDQRQIRHG